MKRRAVLIGAAWFVLTILSVSLPAVLYLGVKAGRLPAGSVWQSGDAFIVRTPMGYRCIGDPQVDGEEFAPVGKVQYSFNYRTLGSPFPVTTTWRFNVVGVIPVPGFYQPSADAGFWRAALAEALGSADPSSAITPAVTRQARQQAAFSRTIWPNVLRLGWYRLVRVPALFALFAPFALVVAVIGARRATERMRRTGTGCCAVCAYNTQGLAPNVPCPECGSTT